MNSTSRAILQTVLVTDVSLSAAERGVVQRLIDGKTSMPVGTETGAEHTLLVTQKRAAELLSVSRATIWRMTKDCVLRPVEIIPGTWRYPLREIIALSKTGVESLLPPETGREKTAA
jgi:predicted DNA-binding transcriptional regulator AlpA